MTSQPTVVQVFDSLRRHSVKALLMGGHACIAYGASEFTRDVAAMRGASEDEFSSILRLQEDDERQADHAYWTPLREELKRLRHARRRDPR